ncbi:MAG: YitT family protein [Ruminococcaceae bacterium]|nr:YitT family protein [Oscillospiraceae bacterium]
MKSKQLKSFIFMNIGCILLSVGVYFFKIPNGFATGGVTGIGTILGKLFPITPAVWIWILNGALLLLGFWFLGWKNSLKTIYCSMFYSALTYLFELFIPLSAPLTNQPLLELVYAMLLTAIGSAMIFNSDASSGGTDIAALIMKKFTDIDVGKALLAVDFVVAVSSFFVFNTQAGLFSLLGLFSKAFLVDSVIESLNTCKYFVVITTKREEISQYIIEALHHGVTVSDAIGDFTKEQRTMIHTVCRRAEAVKLKKKIKEIDPASFVIVTTSSEIIGRGFRNV